MGARISLASISTGSCWGVSCLQRRALQGQQLWLQLMPECPSHCWRCNFVAVLSALPPEMQPMLPRRLEVRAPGFLGRRYLQVAPTHALPCELQPLLPRRAKQRHGAGYEPADVDRARELQRHRGLFFAASLLQQGLWRNGSASDSRSEGWELESLWPQFPLAVAGACPVCSGAPCKASSSGSS